MSFGGGGGTQTTQTSVDVPAWYQQAQQSNIARAGQLANRDYELYEGPRVADWTGDQQDAFALTRAMTGASGGAYDRAADYMEQGGQNVTAPVGNNPWEYNASVMNPAQLGGPATYSAMGPAGTREAVAGQLGSAADYAAAMGSSALGAARNGADFMTSYDNPYNDMVLDRAMTDIDRQEDRALSEARRRAAGAEAFGGSRTAILESETGRRFDDMRGDVISGLRQAGFDTALQAGQTDAGRDADMSQFNAGQIQGLSERNADRATDARRYAAEMGNEFAMRQAGMDHEANMANAGATNATLMDYATRGDSAARYGSDVNNQFSMANMDAQNEAATRNQDAINMARRFGMESFLGAEGMNRANAFQAGDSLAALEGVRRGSRNEDIDRLFNIGELERGLRQRGLDTAYGDFNRQRQHDIEGLQLMIGALSGVPQGMFGTTTTAPGQNNTGGILGGLGSTLGGVASIAGLFSDRRLKQDIVDIGGGWYEYSYIWDPQTRIVGVMADEVDPRYRITGMSGFDMVDYGLMALEA